MPDDRQPRRKHRSFSDDDVVDAIYEAVASSSDWTGALRAVAEALGVAGALLAVTEPDGASLRVETYAGEGHAALRSVRSVATVADVLRAAVARPVGAAFHCDQVGALREYAAFGTVVRRRNVGAAVLLCFERRGRRPLDERRRRLLARVAPHLAQALAVERALARAERKRAVMREVLESLRFGVVVLDERQRLLASNRAAEHLGEFVKRPPRRGRRGSLCDAARRRLEAAETAGTRDGEAVQALTIPRTRGRRPLRLVLAPLCDSAGGRRSTVAFAEDPDLPYRGSVELFARLHALTPAQARLAVLLAEGGSLADIAPSLGLSVHTVRQRLKEIFVRTGTNSQSELVRLLLMGRAAFDRARR
jgi:DNA-binding CsgD family transcriptional regulator